MNAAQRCSDRALPLIVLTAMLFIPREWARGADAPAATGTPGVFDVRSFGGVGDGQTLNTAAFASAVAAAATAGGGTVHVGPGRYLTGMIVLTSHVTLELDAAATLLASQ